MIRNIKIAGKVIFDLILIGSSLIAGIRAYKDLLNDLDKNA